MVTVDGGRNGGSQPRHASSYEVVSICTFSRLLFSLQTKQTVLSIVLVLAQATNILFFAKWKKSDIVLLFCRLRLCCPS